MSEAAPRPNRRVRILPARKPKREGPGVRRRLLRLLWWGGEAAIGVVLGALLFDKVIMPRVVRHGDDVQVPEVVEMAVGEAVALLEDQGLAAELEEGKFSPEVPGGLVLSSSPAGGIEVKRGRRIFLTPSLGTESRAVPELTSMTLRIAQTKLRTVGLEPGRIRYAAVGDVPEGQVLASSPGPGAPVPPEGTVDLLLSREKAAVPMRMPDLTGRAGVEAAAWLEACGFSVQIDETSFPGDPGEILRQEPPPGAAVFPGTQLQIVVAREPGRLDREGEGWRDRLRRRFDR